MRAVILYGTGDAITEQLQLVWEQFVRDTRDAELAAIREILDSADFDAAYQSGRTLSLAEAITVVQDINDLTSAIGSARPWRRGDGASPAVSTSH